MAIGYAQTNGTSNVGLTPDNNVMHTKPDLRVRISNEITRSGSVITDVIVLPIQWLSLSHAVFLAIGSAITVEVS